MHPLSPDLRDEATWLLNFPTRPLTGERLSGVDSRGLDRTMACLTEAADELDRISAAMTFLCDRLDEFERDNIGDANCRDWMGHIVPAVAAARQALEGAMLNGEPPNE